MREVVDLPDAQLAALDAWRATRGMSRVEAIKHAVNVLLVCEECREALTDAEARQAAFGLWKARQLDGLVEQERLRAEWDDR